MLRSLAALCAALLCAATAPVGAKTGGTDGPDDRPAAAGRALFDGRAPLKGRIATHVNDLPPEVVVCANCHAAPLGPEVRQSLAPRLDRARLLDPVARRGGPPTRYDAAAFCRLLRTGVDPARIVNNLEMPRYDVDERQCAALWTYLTSERGTDAR